MQPLQLDRIAAILEGLEETIIAQLIERAQFCCNQEIYRPGRSGFEGDTTHSLFTLRLLYQERMDSAFGRFCVPEERPFHHSLPAPARRVRLPESELRLKDYYTVNCTERILAAYLQLVPGLCLSGDDGQYGSSVEHDVYAVQAISRRIHFGGLYVAECKFRDNRARYKALIDARDREGLLRLLTRIEVEERILGRIREKVETMQLQVNRDVRKIVPPAIIVTFYRDHIIPVTKDAEILYLLQRDTD